MIQLLSGKRAKEANNAALPEIDAAFDKLNKNTKGIVSLVRDLRSLRARIAAAMRAKSLARESLTEDQISAFADFTAYYNGEAATLTQELSWLTHYNEMGDVHDIIEELSSREVDIELLYGWLINISERQRRAIRNLDGIVEAARKTLYLIA